MSAIEPIYTLETCAARLGVKPDTVREWIERRGLRSLPLGEPRVYRHRDFLIRESWLLDWLDLNSRVGVSPAPVVEQKKPAPAATRRRLATIGRDEIAPCPV